jgi:hemerythrin HHE cation binding domain-containing protein
MQTVNQPLRDEHRDFSDPSEVIRQVADGVGGLSLPELRRQIDDVHAFLVERFIPHARADEEAVDPLIERVLDARHATEPMVGESAEVSRLAGKLLALRERLVYSYFGPAQLRSLRNVLYDLHALIEFHLAEADELYPTLLHTRITAAKNGFVA